MMKKNRFMVRQPMTDMQNSESVTEIRREAEYGTDKILLIMQFPENPEQTAQKSALCRDIAAVLGEELSRLPSMERTETEPQQQKAGGTTP